MSGTKLTPRPRSNNTDLNTLVTPDLPAIALADFGMGKRSPTPVPAITLPNSLHDMCRKSDLEITRRR